MERTVKAYKGAKPENDEPYKSREEIAKQWASCFSHVEGLDLPTLEAYIEHAIGQYCRQEYKDMKSFFDEAAASETKDKEAPYSSGKKQAFKVASEFIQNKLFYL